MTADHRLRAEDLPIGEVIDLGGHHVTRDEIISFASQWDPQPFHIDSEFAKGTVFGEVIGSGVHSMAIFQRLAVLAAYRHWAVVAGRTIREVSLMSPLRPNTTVHATVEIGSVTPRSAERSLVVKRGRLLCGDVVLMTMEIDSYVLRRS